MSVDLGLVQGLEFRCTRVMKIVFEVQIINEELITLKPTTCAFGIGLGYREPLFMDFYLLMDILYIGSIGHA